MDISIVIPAFNEAPNLMEVAARLRHVLDGITAEWEIIFVDDGSSDDSWTIISQLHQQSANFRGIRLARNFGQQAAITAGLRHARGNVVIPMDADLQDPPELIPQLLEKWKDGFRIVYAVRQIRHEGWFKKWSAKIFYRLLNRITDIDIALDSGDFCLLDRKVVDAINNLPERHRFIRGLRSWVGFRQTGIVHDRGKRHQGKSKYNIRRLFRLALDGIFSLSVAPLRAVCYLGAIFTIAGLIGAVWALIKAITTSTAFPGYSIAVILLLVIGGIQLIALGIIGEYMYRIFDQAKGRPSYIIQDTLPSTSFEP